MGNKQARLSSTDTICALCSYSTDLWQAHEKLVKIWKKTAFAGSKHKEERLLKTSKQICSASTLRSEKTDIMGEVNVSQKCCWFYI